MQRVFQLAPLLFVLVVCAPTKPSDANLFKHPTVVDLTSDNFAEKIAEKVAFIKFYAPWCGHCKNLAPTWAQLGDKFANDSDIIIAHVDCTLHKGVCAQAEVKGYPTLKAFINGEEYKAYSGARDLNSLTKFIKEVYADATKLAEE
eukprot:TRINITY_DN49405_c1_g1_i2.p4 TRINITY_DN49405_c1_g1~~TRINITY_DN49405_c1_g1_i2.p4  ORF type:complete len:146 (+),score=12.42 TRINITY_DN49405_c1_g1_i2:267-704(+)